MAARRASLVAGIVGLLALGAGALVDLDAVYRSYLLGYVFWLGVALGCLAVLMIQHLTGGAWGIVTRRLLEAGTRTLPVMVLLFLPLLTGIRSLYPWARPEAVAADELLQHKAPYLNVTFFLARAALYFAAWCALAWILNRMSRYQDRTGDERLIRRFVMLSAGGLLVFVATMTFASVDWVMSLEPHWVSTIYGPLMMAGQTVSAFCFVILVAVSVSGTRQGADFALTVTPSHAHDLGKLLFTFVMVWAYFALSQFLIIWSGNLPEEIPWYLTRLSGGWRWIGLAIIVLHFFLPFGLLLMRGVKRNLGRLRAVAALVFLMRVVDTWWTIAPAFGAPALARAWMYFAAVAGLGGVWVHLYLRELARMPLLPLRDPELREALSHGNG